MERSGITIGAVVGSCVAGFLLGLAVTAILSFFYLKRRQQRIPGSPHYISKQNSYVTVPMKEVKLSFIRVTTIPHAFWNKTRSPLDTGKHQATT